MFEFRGVHTALITPFRDGVIDVVALERIVAAQVAAGVDGLVPCGTTGESPTLRDDEHHAVIACVIHAAKTAKPAPTGARPRVIAGVGTNNTARTVANARVATEAGADGLMVVSPYYNRPTQEGLFRHFSHVAQATPLPIMLYNIPGRTGVEISVETICRLRAAHANIAAVKHATGTVDGAAELLSRCDVTVLSGDDPLTLPLMSLGATGVVSVLSNLVPRAVKRLTDAALAGDLASARQAHRALYSAGKALLSLATNPIPIKSAMAMRGWCAEEFRLPLCPLDDAARPRLAEAIERMAELD